MVIEASSPAEALRQWRKDVHACRVCRDGLPLLHHEPPPDGLEVRCGWARPMLDKSPDPNLNLEVLGRSCRSGIVIVLEAPNHDDTFNLKKGYLTCDTDTDETGKFLLQLLNRVDLSPADVVLTNTVQCLPARKAERHPVSALQRQNCRNHLSRLFQITQPRVVIAFGNASLLALHRFSPVNIDGRVLSNAELKVSRLVALPIAPWAGTVLLPLFHPGPIVRANAYKKDGTPGSGRSAEQQLLDIQTLRDILDRSASPPS